MYETLDDLVEALLDRIGKCGSCSDKCTEQNRCRCRAAVALRRRIIDAVTNSV